MLTLYCDASGKDDRDVMVVAGFIASTDDWLNFEREWDRVLRHFKLGYFHMVEFAQSVKQFRGWKDDEERRRQLLTGLAMVIARHAKFWVGASVYLKDYSKVDAEYKLHEHFFPYPLCGLTCVDIAEKWRDAHHMLDIPTEYVFEGGDEHRGQLVERIEEKTGVIPTFRTRLKAVPLQAADFAAYELGKMYRTLLKNGLWERFRSSFQLLKTVHNQWGDFDEQSLRIICRLEDVPRRDQS